MRLRGKTAPGVTDNVDMLLGHMVRLRAAREQSEELRGFQVRINLLISKFKEFEDNFEPLKSFTQERDLTKFAS